MLNFNFCQADIQKFDFKDWWYDTGTSLLKVLYYFEILNQILIKKIKKHHNLTKLIFLDNFSFKSKSFLLCFYQIRLCTLP